MRTDSGPVRINANGFWVRTVDAASPDAGNQFFLLPADDLFTNRIAPMIESGVRRMEGSRLPGESPIAVTVQYIANTAFDEDAIRTAAASIPRLSDNQYPVPALQKVASPTEFTRRSGFFNLEPGNVNENDDLYPNGQFVGGSHITYVTPFIGLKAVFDHEFWHAFANYSNNHPTNGGIGDFSVVRIDATDDRVIAAIFRMKPDARAGDYGLGGTVGSGSASSVTGGLSLPGLGMGLDSRHDRDENRSRSGGSGPRAER